MIKVINNISKFVTQNVEIGGCIKCGNQVQSENSNLSKFKGLGQIWEVSFRVGPKNAINFFQVFVGSE